MNADLEKCFEYMQEGNLEVLAIWAPTTYDDAQGEWGAEVQADADGCHAAYLSVKDFPGICREARKAAEEQMRALGRIPEGPCEHTIPLPLEAQP